LSAAASAIPGLKAAVRRLTLTSCRRLAETALWQTSAADVRAILIGAAERALETTP
jgi:phosphoenolpyruvate-protein kinase (PTS system EI component)